MTVLLATVGEPWWLVYVVPAATVVLVFVTGWNAILVRQYTRATKRMVDEMAATRASQVAAVEEMRRAREAEIRPHAVPYVKQLDARQPHVHFGVRNVGNGAALNLDVVLTGDLVPYHLRCPVLMPGEVRLVPKGDGDPAVIDPESLDGRVLVVSGHCEDVAGTIHCVASQTPLTDSWRRHKPAAVEVE